MIAAHLQDCSSCRADFTAIDGLIAAQARHLRRLTWAILITLCVVTAAALWLRRPPDDATRRLSGVVSTSGRDLQPRLTGGFAWAPLHHGMRGSSGSMQLSLMAAVDEVIDRSRSDPSPEAQRSAAAAHLIAGESAEAMASLERVVASDPRADAWSDLAAAQFAVALHDDEPLLLVRALASADAALKLDPAIPEARFNRALILERIGLREQAANGWQEYLRVDPASGWANEAREHLRSLAPQPAFKEVLQREYDRLLADPSSARALAREYRLDARLWGETEILARWATAEREGNRTLAAKHLAVARELGSELARDRGDGMLEALVAAIDRARGTQRSDLAAAHLAFRNGQRTYRDNQPARAEPILRDAAGAFERGGSPGALLARYFAANTAYSQGRIDESGRALDELLRTAPAEFIAHRGQLLWQIGLVHFARADWGKCIDAITESVAIFERLDERRYAANVRQTLANAYQRIGDPAMAWKHNIAALREIGQRPSTQLVTMLTSSSMAAAKSAQWPVATSLMTIAVDVSRQAGDSAAEVSTLLLRARLYAMTNDLAAARATVAEARRAMAKLKDPGFEALFEANAKRIDAMLASDPATAAELLTGAIEFHSTRGRRAYLPELYLERGRARRQAGDRGGAGADFEAGVSALESGRETLPAGEDRWGLFNGAEDLFHEAIALSLADRDITRAFEYVERARARALLDAMGARWPVVNPSAIPPRTVVLEYVVMPAGLVIFTLGHHGIRVVETPVDGSRLAAQITALVDAAQQSDRPRVQRLGRSLHRALIEPVEAELIGRERVVIVPDAKLARLPFATLVDGSNRLLIESHIISVAPSAAAFAQLARRDGSKGERRVLVVTGSGGSEPLAEVTREANAVAALYTGTRRLRADEATPDSFAREAAAAEVIHFAGHGVARAKGRDGYLLLGGESEEKSKLGLKEIASLRLERTSVVILAACSTADGEVQSSEGTISVARAFLAAGVPSVVATLWPIADHHAADFFPLIHRHIARGVDPDEAVRLAQLEWSRRPDAPISMWAAVQLIGR